MYTFLKIAIAFAAASFAYGSARADDVPPFSSSLAFGRSGIFIQKDGPTLYRAICQGCHMPDARGAKGAGEYPALAANPKLAAATFPLARVLRGWLGMPSFANNLDDAQIADVVNYVRTHFDNHYSDTITADDVARLRASTPDRGN